MTTIVTHGHNRGHAWRRLLATRMVGENCFPTRQHYILYVTGVYCTPKLSTAWGYARPQVVFGDGAYHRVILELRVSEAQRKKKRAKGGEQWVFESEDVRVHGVWIGVNMPPSSGEERLSHWDAQDEAVPPGRQQAPPSHVSVVMRPHLSRIFLPLYHLTSVCVILIDVFSALQPGQVQAIVNLREPCSPWTDPQSVPADVSGLPQDADVLHEFHTSSGAVASSSSMAPASMSSTPAEPPSPRPGDFGSPPPPPPGPPPAVTLTPPPPPPKWPPPAPPAPEPVGQRRAAPPPPEPELQPKSRPRSARGACGSDPGAGGSRPASVAGGSDPGAGGSDPAPGAGRGPPPPARVVACSFGKWHRQPPLGHIRVDLAEVARAYGFVRAPGGGVVTSGLNPGVRAQVSAAPAYRKILDACADCILQLAKQGIPEIKVAVGCKWGKHRSVSFCIDLQEHQSLAGFASVQVFHLEQFRWDRSARPVADMGWSENTVLVLDSSGMR